jgi:hypothetical protein
LNTFCQRNYLYDTQLNYVHVGYVLKERVKLLIELIMWTYKHELVEMLKVSEIIVTMFKKLL